MINRIYVNANKMRRRGRFLSWPSLTPFRNKKSRDEKASIWGVVLGGFVLGRVGPDPAGRRGIFYVFILERLNGPWCVSKCVNSHSETYVPWSTCPPTALIARNFPASLRCSPRYPFDVPLAGPNSRRYRSNMFASTIVASFLIKL